MPLARLEKNRNRTPLLPEPTAMDMLFDQLKVNFGLCLSVHKKGKNAFTAVFMLNSSC